MTIPVYNTGTVSVSANGTVVSNGATAIWSNGNVKEGDWIVIDGEAMTMVLSVVDTEHITIPEWQGGAKTSVSYAIYQNYSERNGGTPIAKDVGTLVAALNKEGFIWFVGPDEVSPDPSRGDDGQFAYQPTTGKQWHKEGGAWLYDGIFKGFGVPAPYDNGKTYSLNDVATSGGSSYVFINTTPSAGHAPPNATYWAVLAGKGDTGSAATIAVGTVTTGAPGSSATVVNSGTTGAAVFNFTIPRGAPGSGDMSSVNYGSEYAANYPLLRSNIGLGNAAVHAETDFLRVDATTTLSAAERRRAASAQQMMVHPQGRLSLAAGIRVMAGNYLNIEYMYYVACVGNKVPLFDGTGFYAAAFSTLSCHVQDTTKNPEIIGVSTVNDWFIWDDAGTIRLCHGPAWPSILARGTGAGSSELGEYQGILLNNYSITNGPGATRGTYVGTSYSSADGRFNWIMPSAASGGGGGRFSVWNYYNRRMIGGTVIDLGAYSTSSSITPRAFNNSVNNRVIFVSGLPEESIFASFTAMYSTGGYHRVGIAMDTTSAFDFQGYTASVAGQIGQHPSGCYPPVIGAHYVAAIEAADGANAPTYAVPGSGAAAGVQGLKFHTMM